MKTSLLRGLALIAAPIAVFAQGQTVRTEEDPNKPYPVHQDAIPRDGAEIPVVGIRTPIVHTPAGTQHPDGPADSSIPTDLGARKIDSLHYDSQGGAQWVHGATYKARADEQGFSFMPFLGSDAPKTYEFQLTLDSATLGGESIPLTRAATVSKKGNRFTLDRGPIDVTYDMSLKSVEQSFVLELAGIDAPLTLDLQVQTELAYELRKDGIYYTNERGGLTYSHAVVIDGAGQRLELPIQANQNQIHLVVPASYMAQSVAPVIVDPVLQTFTVHSGFPYDITHPDVAYDFGTDTFAFVHQSKFSATDDDIWLERRTSNGIFLDVESIDFRLSSDRNPSIASDNTSNQYLVAYRHRTLGDRWEVIARTVDATDTTRVSPIVLIASVIGVFGDTFGWSNDHLDVGGKSQGSPLFKVVWSRRFYQASGSDADIRSVAITPITPLNTSTPPMVSPARGESVGPLYDDIKPKVSESSGEASVAEWRIAFISREIANNDYTLQTSITADDNTLTMGTATFLDPSPGFFPVSLDISEGLSALEGPIANTPVYMTAVHYNVSGSAELWTRGLQNASAFDAFELNTREHEGPALRPRYPSISTSRRRFTIAYTEYSPANNEYTSYATSLDLNHNMRWGVNERRVQIANHGNLYELRGPATASRYSGGNYTSRYVGTVASVHNTLRWTQRAAILYPSLSHTPGYQYCVGNPNSTGDYGFITMTGSAQTTGIKTLRASTLPSFQFGYFLGSLGGSNSIQPPGSSGRLCLLGGPLGRFNRPLEVFFTNAGSTATLDIDPSALRGPAGNVVGATGQTWNFQAWHRESGGDSNFTNAIHLTFE